MGSTNEHVSEDRSIFAAIRSSQVRGGYQESDELVTHCAREISRLTKFRLDPWVLSQPSRIPEVATTNLGEYPVPRLGFRGQELPSVLYYLAETQDPSLAKIVEKLRTVSTNFSDFEFNRVDVDRIGFSVRFDDTRGLVPASNLSDGTLTLIGLCVLLMTPDRPSVLCLEEPENGLTPRATRTIYEAIKELTVAEPPASRSQVLVSSHSPYVITEAWNGEDRDFIYQLKPDEGKALVRSFTQIVADHQIHLAIDGSGNRSRLSLNTADEVMEGYYS